ncbi:MAG: DUF4359 domain-containing protein [Gammaproteobacteria bacterium]
MKSVPTTIIIIALSGLLVFTNPTMDSYEQFVHQKIIQEATKQDNLSQALGLLFGGIASHLLANATIRQDYLLLSVYDTDFGNDHLRALGILNHFFVLETPISRQKANDDSKGSTQHDGSSPQTASDQIDKKALNEQVRDIIKRDFKVGPITVSTHGKCSPILNECETYAVLHYGDQSSKIDSTGSYFHPISENEVSWVDNRYVTIDYETGGNCWTCDGIDVAALEDSKLFYLGKFSRFEEGYLVKPYDGLEINELTSHARSPVWNLYVRYSKGKATLDINKTCLTAKARYETDKNNLLHALSRKVDTSVDEHGWSLEDNVKASLLGTLALARYCGWQNDYEEIIKAARSSHFLVTSEILQKLSKELAKVQLAEAAQ